MKKYILQNAAVIKLFIVLIGLLLDEPIVNLDDMTAISELDSFQNITNNYYKIVVEWW